MKNHHKSYIKNYMANEENRKKTLAKANEYRINKRKTDPVFVIVDRVRSRLNQFIRNHGHKKPSKTQDMIGCTWEELKLHLEKQFAEGMGWDNRDQWHIDHIVPLASANTVDDVIRLSHYTNLQPLWAIDNLIKGDKLPHEHKSKGVIP